MMRALCPSGAGGTRLKNIHSWCCSVVLLCAGGSAQAAEAYRYTVIMEAGTVAGHQIVDPR